MMINERAQRLVELVAGIAVSVVGLWDLVALEVALRQDRDRLARTVVVDVPHTLARFLLIGPYLVALAALPLLGIAVGIVLRAHVDRVRSQVVVAASAMVFALLGTAILVLAPVGLPSPRVLLVAPACLGLLTAAAVSWHDLSRRQYAQSNENC